MSLGRRDLLSAMAVLGTGSLSGCARRDEDLRVWAMGVEGEALGKFAESFAKTRPEIKVRVQALPWSAAHEKLLPAFAADNLPDVVALGNTWLPEFAALNALEPLDALLSKGHIDVAHVFSGARDGVQFSGATMAVPWYVDTRLIFYRKDILKSVGFDTVASNWTGWDAQLQALSRQEKGRFGLFMPLDEFEPLVAFCLQQDDPILSEGATRGNFQSPGMRKAFAYVASLYKRGFSPAAATSEIANLYDEFAKGTFSFFITGPWNIGEFTKRLPPDLKDAWATSPLPGPKGWGASLSGGVSLAIPKSSQRKDRAFAFIEYLCAAQSQADFNKVTGDLPADQRAWDMAGLKADPKPKAFFDQLVIAKPAPPAPEWERIATEMRLAMERIVRGIQTQDQALKGLDEFADDALSKRRWILAQGRRA